MQLTTPPISRNRLAFKPSARRLDGVIVLMLLWAVFSPFGNRLSRLESFPTNTWQTYTIQGVLAGAGMNGTNAIAKEVRQVFVPPAHEPLTYDVAGNRKSDSRWTYTWNDIGQLTSAVDNNPSGAKQLNFTYDLFGRLVQKTVTVGGTLTKRTITLYDLRKPVLRIEYDGVGFELSRCIYTWGPDVSGKIDEAAGVGGLIEILTKKGNTTTRSLAINDGIGSVLGLVDGTTGAKVATFSYGPFGEMIEASGERAGSCPLRYQTKTYDEDLQLYYFEGRWYDPRTQCWLSPDPLGVASGDFPNDYWAFRNDPFGFYDALGGQSVSRATYDPDWEEYLRWHERNRRQLGQNHPWWARILGFGNAISGAIAVPAGLAGSEAQAQVLASPFIVASTVTMGQPEDIKAIGGGLVTMSQNPFGQGQLFGTGLLMLTGPKLVKLPFAIPGESQLTRLPGTSRLSVFLPWAAESGRIGSPIGLSAAQGTGAGIKYIGKLDDLQGIPRSQTLLDDLPDLGSARANYYQNSSVLRKALRDGFKIRDASAYRPNWSPDPTLLRPDRTIGQSFLGAERNILDNKGFIMNLNGVYGPR